jgi:hypothetical protein
VSNTAQGQQPLLERLSGSSWVPQYGDYPGSPDSRTAGEPTSDATGVCIAGGSYGPSNDQGGPDRTNILIHIGTSHGWVSTVGPLASAGADEGSQIAPFVCDGAGHCYAAASDQGGDGPFDFIETFVN